MGGHLTVSSKEHHGSTFTFVLSYKVSLVCDSSDDPDELSDMAGHEGIADAYEDDIHCGFFQFQPRTLGSLFALHNSGRNQKALSNNYRFDTLHRSNRGSNDSCLFSSENSGEETSSVGDTSSIDAAVKTSSEPENSECFSPHTDKHRAVTKNNQSKGKMDCQPSEMCCSSGTSNLSNDQGEIPGKAATQETCQTQTESDPSSECSSSNSSEIPISPLKPKILLVEDNKINVMVTQSMMKQLGHKIDVVNNGVEAVRAVQRSNYDLILMVS